MALTKIKTSNITDDAVTTAKLYTENLGRRNLIINGAMNIWQRATTKTFTANDTADYHTADRWGQFVDIDAGSGSLSVTISQSTDVPSTEPFTYSLKGATTPSSFVPGGSDNLALFTYKVETYDANPLGWGTSGAKAATLSYWIKSDTVGTGTLQVRLPDSSIVSGEADGNYYTTFTINQANTWEYKTHLIPANTTDGWRRDSSQTAVHLHWYFGSNQSNVATEDAWFRSNNHGTPHSDNTFDFMTNAGEAYLTGVQFEVGSEATPFEHRRYGEELSLCQRYFFKNSTSSKNGVAIRFDSGRKYRGIYYLPVTMRTTPSSSVSSINYQWGGSTRAGTNVSVDSAPDVLTPRLDASSATDTDGTAIMLTISTITADAELN